MKNAFFTFVFFWSILLGYIDPGETWDFESLRERVEELAAITYLTDQSLEAFDRALKLAEGGSRPFHLFRSEAYSELLIGRFLMEKGIRDFLQTYRNYVGSVLSSGQYHKLRIISSLKPHLLAIDRTFAQNLIDEMTSFLSQSMKRDMQYAGLRHISLELSEIKVFADEFLKPCCKDHIGSVVREWVVSQVFENLNQQAMSLREKHRELLKSEFENGSSTWFGEDLTENVWILTYSGGPKRDGSTHVLQVLAENGVPATFFGNPDNIFRHGDIVLSARRQGIGIQFQGKDFGRMGHFDCEVGVGAIIDINAYLKTHLGESPQYFRPMFGVQFCSEELREALAEKGLFTVLWNIDSLDWKDENVDSIYQRVRFQMEIKGAGVILFHDTDSRGAVVSSLILKDAVQTGRFLTVSEAIDEFKKSKKNDEY